MSELINNSRNRIDELKKLILDLHKGEDIETVKSKLNNALGSIPYGEVVQAEEELITEGFDREEILQFCDLHTEALKGNIDTSFAKQVQPGHPVDIFIKENREIEKVIGQIKHLFAEVSVKNENDNAVTFFYSLREMFNSLMDIEKHYQRKENLLFPFLEKYNITGPPMVMWGKHDEIREFLKSCYSIFDESKETTVETFIGFVDLMFRPTVKAVSEMIYKEEKILFPMCLDTLTDIDWYEIKQQSDDFGYCLFYPEVEWVPNFAVEESKKNESSDRIRLETGSFTKEELESVLNNLPFDITFVDKDDKVRFFSHGKDRIFQRAKTILGRQVQFCHPPSSVHIVNQIVEDFKSGRQDSAKFWINLHGKFVHIAYYAIRNEKGEYLGTTEISHDINEYRNINGERRILQYEK